LAGSPIQLKPRGEAGLAVAAGGLAGVAVGEADGDVLGGEAFGYYWGGEDLE
jgi:hypothetical protein